MFNFYKKIHDIINNKETNPKFILNSEKEKQDENLEEKQVENLFKCEFCSKEYVNLTSLKHHQKTARFCLELQNKKIEKEDLFICEFCNKEFTVKHSYHSHIVICKSKSTTFESELKECKKELEHYKKELEQQTNNHKKELEQQSNELKLKLSFKDETITKLEKEIKDCKKIIVNLTMPTNNVQRDNDVNNSYTIHFNKLFNNIETLSDSSIKNRIKNRIKIISINKIELYEYKNVSEIVIISLTNVLKDFTFCTDKSMRTMVIKDENNKVKNIVLEDFITHCIIKGNNELNEYLDKVLYYINDLVKTNYIKEEVLYESISKIDDIKKSINNDNFNIKDDNNPFKKMISHFIMNCDHINKMHFENS